MLTSERTEALCKYEGSKKDFQELAYKAAYYLQELRKETNTLITGIDFLEMDLVACSNCVNNLKEIQVKAKKLIERIDELKQTYKFD